MTADNAWFESWFDTKYYHIFTSIAMTTRRSILFAISLTSFSRLNAHILDLACGRGRHAIFLNEMGFEVTGIDLSESNIEYARQFANDCLHFEVGDMREPFGAVRFDYIFNLFTSFGYFENRADNLRALRMMKQALKPGGNLVMDFMNVNKVRLGLVEEEVRQADGIEFHIERFIRDNQVIKEIRFEDAGKRHHFEEKVQLLERDDFEELFSEAGFKISDVYGDFSLRVSST